jgi:hypothetical protein
MTCPCGNSHEGNEAFYVTVQDAGKTGFLAGPFKNHEYALQWVDKTRKIAEEIDPRAAFYSFGTSSQKLSPTGNNAGSLNEKLGLPGRSTLWGRCID